MAAYGFSITKSATWRTGAERFSNVYHYNIVGSPSDVDFEGIIDGLVVDEKAVHDATTLFVEARAWGPTDGPESANLIRFVKDLSGPGTLSGGGAIGRELAVVVQFLLGRSPTTQRRVYLRKYIHAGRIPVSSAGSDAAIGNSNLAAGDKSPFTTYGNNIRVQNVGASAFGLCSPRGQVLDPSTTTRVLDALHVRQLKN